MAFAPLKCTGTKKIGGTDVSAQVTSMTFYGERDQVVIPETFGTDESFAAGAQRWFVRIEFLQDVDAAAISMVLFDAFDDADGELTVAATLRDGAVSAANPELQATAIVTNTGDIGGRVNEIVTGSVTFPLLAKPVAAES